MATMKCTPQNSFFREEQIWPPCSESHHVGTMSRFPALDLSELGWDVKAEAFM